MLNFVLNNNNDIKILPTANSSDEHVEIHEETICGGPNNEFNISGVGLLCECAYVLTWKCHVTHGSLSEKNFAQKICTLTRGASVVFCS